MASLLSIARSTRRDGGVLEAWRRRRADDQGPLLKLTRSRHLDLPGIHWRPAGLRRGRIVSAATDDVEATAAGRGAPSAVVVAARGGGTSISTRKSPSRE